jgi:hypothetical protein
MPNTVLFALFILTYVIGHLTVTPNGITLMQDSDSSGILTRNMNVLADVVVLLVLLIYLRRPSIHSNWHSRPWILGMASWVGLLVISGWIGLSNGRIDLIALSAGFRAYLRVFIPFLIGMFMLGKDNVRWIWKAMLVIGFVQVPLAFLQVFLDSTPDFVCGLMGLAGSGRLGTFQIVCVGILIARFLNNPKAQNAASQMRNLTILIGGSVILIVPLFLAESNAAFVGMGIVVFAILRRRLLSFRGLVLWISIGSVLIFSVVKYSEILATVTQTDVRENRLAYFIQPSLLAESLLGPDLADVNGRFQSFGEFNRLLSDSGDFLWGYGPGLLAYSIIAPSRETAFLMRFKDQVLGSLVFGAQILIETGYLGVLWWCIFFLLIFKRWSRANRRLGTMADRRYMLDAFIGFFAAICFTLIYNLGILAPTLYLPFMLVSGYVVRLANE